MLLIVFRFNFSPAPPYSYDVPKDGYHATHNSYLLPLYTFFVPYFDEQDDDAEDETD